MSMMSIRTATPRDREAIRLVEEHAFGQKAEAGLVDALVAGGESVLELVAEEEGHVVGHILFSRLYVEGGGKRFAAVALAPLADATEGLRRGQEDILRLTGDVRSLKSAVETLKDGLDWARSESTAKQAQFVERTERAVREIGAQVAELGQQVQRTEKIAPQPAGMSPELGERLDRLDKTLAALTSTKEAQPAVPEPSQTASVQAPKPADRDTPIEGWLLHEVYDGLAIVEGRRGQFYEVGRGDTLPGAGRVETIERRAKRWVVVTNRGIITTAR